jgi:hypothetical protein
VVEIKEGPELDRAVAQAIGLICTHRVLGSDIEFYVDPQDGTDTVPRTFNPSTNLNDAFRAAEAVAKDFYGSVELPPCITVDNRTGWRCTIEDSPEGRGKTPALAICAAILKVTEKKLK